MRRRAAWARPGSWPRPVVAVGGVVALTAVTSALSAAFAVLTARDLGPGGRGVLVVILTASTLTSLLGTFGFNTTGRYLLVARDGGPPAVGLGDYLALARVLAAGVATALGAAGALLVWVGVVKATPAQVVALAVTGGLVLLSSTTVDAIHALGRHVQATACAAAGSAVSLGLAVLVLVSDAGTVAAYSWAWAAGCAAVAVVGRGCLRRDVATAAPSDRLQGWRLLLGRGLSTLGVTFGQAMTFRVDRLLLAALQPPRAVGIYAVAATLPEVLRLVPYAVSQVAFRMSSAGELTSDRQVLRIRTWALTAVVVPGLVAFVLAPDLVILVFGASYADAVTPLRVLLLGELAVAAYYIDSRVVSGAGRAALAGRLSWAGLALSVLLDLLLMPRYGATGAAVAAVLSYAALSGSMVVATRRALRGREGTVSHA